ncbi:MAG TPA: 3-phosphoglycerate dehydrogenase family protein [Gammaproteobacteria bacterium]|nr:3-phosphoglycerate dehydrogenase [Gammaproteobacteria bacterium]HJM09163.1 3-phosphoglycerate dehydrogenase family protein [Gammaproteobacteria bacterium]HJN01219.1 3-phosphoglycerate dehydrogenase family protein [Gammaproteobacteria bacterium]|tara:strand:- start:10193 stop:11383 length:1191 start_codon:yes stop_codon:yes gene_type:complete
MNFQNYTNDMYKVLKLNNIAEEGLKVFNSERYHCGDDVTNPDAIILRSYDMHEMDIPKDLRAVGRAGSGVNNIPIDKYTEKAIPVFNAPGANSNAVKELVLASILIAARNIHSAIKYVELVKDSENLKSDIEHGKKAYVGFELPAKTLGVIGLGQIGVKVANAAYDLGMNVIGYDPLITVDNAINLQPGIQNVNDLKELLNDSNIVTIHIPHKKETENFIGDNEIKKLKEGSIIINLSREAIVDTNAILKNLETNKIKTYVTDFPSEEMIDHKDVLVMPHLGASTKEAEINCAVMVANSLKSYLESGNILNSVNFPDVKLTINSPHRLTITNKNMPNIIGQFTSVLGNSQINIDDLSHKVLNEIGYTILNVDKPISENVLDEISNIEGVMKVNILF